MAAVSASFLDSTLGMGMEDGMNGGTSQRLPESLQSPCSKPSDLLCADQEGAARVIPQLLESLWTNLPARQRLHMQLLVDRLDDLLSFDDTTETEMLGLLTMLFAFAQRRGGLTPLQKRHNTEVSDNAFRSLHRLMGVPHAKTSLVLRALRRLCDALGCGTTSATDEPIEVAAPAVAEAYRAAVDYLAEKATAAEQALQLARAREAASQHSTSLEALHRPPVSNAPMAEFRTRSMADYSLDALPEGMRRGACELEFCAVVAWFMSLPPMDGADSAGGQGTNEPRDASSLFTNGDCVGYRFIDAEFAVMRLRKGVGDSSLLLLDLLRVMFPLATDRALLKRLHGMVLNDKEPALHDVDPTTEDPTTNASGGPSGALSTSEAAKALSLAMDLEVPPYVKSAHALSLWVNRGQPSLLEHTDVLHLITEWVGWMDLGHAGFVPATAVIGTSPWDALVRGIFVKLRKSRLTVYDLVLFLSSHGQPAETFDRLKGVVAAAVRAVEKQYAADVKRRQEENTKYQLELLRFVHGPDASGDGVSAVPNPGGDAATAMSLAGNTAMLSIAAVLRREHDAMCAAAWDRAAAERDVEQIAVQRTEAMSQQAAESMTVSRAQVLPLAGPPLPPPAVDLYGFRVNRAVLELDAFLEEPGTRAHVCQILQFLDASCFPPGWFLRVPSAAHLYISGPLFSSSAKVYRDLCVCPPRPPTGRHWKGSHKLSIVTNIPKHSDVKYRLAIEGYNFGTNRAIFTVVVGHAARELEPIAALESCGWPDGWDRSAVLNFSGGFERVEQRYDDDGFVVLDAEATSLVHVGFAVSAWLVVPSYGDGFGLTAHVVHL